MEIVRRGNQRNGKNYRDDLIVFYKRAGTDGEPGNIIYGKKVPVKNQKVSNRFWMKNSTAFIPFR